jgi:hypothetical protein
MVDLSIKLWVALTEPETLVDFKKLHSLSISENSQKGFCNRVFSGINALEDHLVDELFKLENSPEITRSITSWP